MISRLEHKVLDLPVWGSGATVVHHRRIRGLCAGPSKFKAAAGPQALNPITGASLAGAAPTWVSVQVCMKHWEIESRDEVKIELLVNNVKHELL